MLMIDDIFPPLCVCDIPDPDAWGECRVCRRPWWNNGAAHRERWRKALPLLVQQYNRERMSGMPIAKLSMFHMEI